MPDATRWFDEVTDLDVLRDEIRQLKDDYQGACELAWDLYMAGTEQTIETFRGTRNSGPDAPIEDVRQHIRELKASKVSSTVSYTGRNGFQDPM